MSVSTEQSNISRFEREIMDIDKKIGDQEKREADLFKQVAAYQAQASKSSSVLLASSYTRQSEQAQSRIHSVKSEKVRLHSEKARKHDQLRRAKESLMREEGYTRQREKTRAANEQRDADARARRQRAADDALRKQEVAERLALRAELDALKGNWGQPTDVASTVHAEHDFFISHASEDKEGFVRSLAEALRAQNAKVWYDEFSLRVGDNLRRSIEKGIANSKYGVVVLSPDFFRKEWPQRELDALFALDTHEAPKVLPIWHRVSYDEVLAASPILASRVGLKTALISLDDIVRQLMDRLE